MIVLASNEEMIEELKKIRMLLEPKPAPPAPPAPTGLWNEFKDFLNKYKVLGLAIAFIMGVYLGGLVQSLVKDLLLPLIGLAIPGLGNLATWKVGVPSTTLDARAGEARATAGTRCAAQGGRRRLSGHRAVPQR